VEKTGGGVTQARKIVKTLEGRFFGRAVLSRNQRCLGGQISETKIGKNPERWWVDEGKNTRQSRTKGTKKSAKKKFVKREDGRTETIQGWQSSIDRRGKNWGSPGKCTNKRLGVEERGP